MQQKPLEDMTLQELWELFPIILSEHKDCWRQWAAEEISVLETVLGRDAKRISHIGSTAVERIMAKPIVDILLEAADGTSFDAIRPRIESVGYRLMSESGTRMSFNKGYTPDGFADKVFHLHLRRAGDNDELRFRDYLNAHPDTAQEYESLKIGLWKRFEHDRDAYTRAKTDFIVRHTRLAKLENPDE